MHRLEHHPAEWIERNRPLTFTFEGRELHGYAGDTISSALAAAGLAYLGRSFKYHRPRSVLSSADHDSNALFRVDGVPNVRGDVTALREGMRVAAVNTFGGLFQDQARVLDWFGRLLPVGFYYKAFHSKRWFPRWEQMFRTLTGLGQVSLTAPRLATPKRYAFCDVLVIGGGPSGIAAALAAARAGASVTLVDEAPRLGGSAAHAAELQGLVAEVAATSAIQVLPLTYAAGAYADHWIALAEPARLTKMRARAVVYATGAIEQPAVFRNNDLPGIQLASGALRLLARQRVAPGRNIVIVAANLEAYAAAGRLRDEGIGVAAIVDLRGAAEFNADEGSIAAARTLAGAGVRVLQAFAPYEALDGVEGGVRALVVGPLTAPGTVDVARLETIYCDGILMSVGWAAAAQLLLQAGGTTRFAPELQQYLPERLPAGAFAAGRLNGVYELESRLADGARAGTQAAAHAQATDHAHAAAGARGAVAGAAAAQVLVPRSLRRPSHPFPIVDHPRGKNFVDFDEDLQVKDLENAAQEGFDSSELMKRYSTVGMGPSQGKHSNMNALRVLARYRGLDVSALGLTTARPMYHPVPLKLLAGRSFQAERRTPIDAAHAAAGAVWMPAGNWRRPEYYAVAGETREQSIAAEVRAVRERVGLIDVGTLGKIEIHGPQAGLFLDRAYAGKFSELRVGMSRYGLMLDESGVIVDDGVVARLGEESYYFTTTTGGSATVFRELLRLNALWGLDCGLVNVTGHRAAFNFAGPASRMILQGLTDIDLGEAAFPYLAARSARVAGCRARLLRVGFVGELGYEIHVAAGDGPGVWKALAAAGSSAGLRLFGVEAQRVLRLEKGHVIVGQDTDGLTDPFEANSMFAVSMKKPFFVGQRSLRILQARGPRQVLVGIEVLDPVLTPKECHLIVDGDAILGRVTSITRSAALGKTIGLAMLEPARAAAGGDLSIRIEGGTLLAARIVPTPFYDPQQLRQKLGGVA